VTNEHGEMKKYEMPELMKWAANFIQRVGFPICMCLVLSYLMFVVLDRNTKAVNDLRFAIVMLTERIQPYKQTP
jgi:hypothetical protein